MGMHMHFSFLFIFVFMPAVAICIFLISLARDRAREENLFRTGILYLKNFRSLLTHIQQHRGLTNSYICGYKNYEFDIEQLEELVRNEIYNMEAIDSWIKNNSKWQSIIDHWSRLNLNYKNSGAEYNLKQHNILIASSLYLVDDLAYSHQLTLPIQTGDICCRSQNISGRLAHWEWVRLVGVNVQLSCVRN